MRSHLAEYERWKEGRREFGRSPCEGEKTVNDSSNAS